MRLVFFDPVPWNYDYNTPLDTGLGGSQSAACYLSAELAKRAHDVVYINWITEPKTVEGVRFIGRDHKDEDEIVNSSDALIVLNDAIGQNLRKAGIKTKMILWCQHDVDQPGIAELNNGQEHDAWEKIVFVSRWQHERFVRKMGVTKGEVIYNAVSPPFIGANIRPAWYETGEPPVLAYTSTPFRGLEGLLKAFPAIRDAIPDVRLKVFSSMAVYRDSDAPYANLYQKASLMRGVEYIGSVGQARLAEELAVCAALAYPCSFLETFCIGGIEAVASGAIPIIPCMGAFREVLDASAMYYVGKFDKSVIAVLKYQRENPEKSADVRMAAIIKFRQEFTWSRRAEQWEAMLGAL
jgi:glycosyltransferase involved in cell wall biosynthesis